MPASGASLLLNAEGIAAALLAWFVFKEIVDRRVARGMAAIVAGAVVLSWPGQADFARIWPTLAILGACLAWGMGDNLTRKVARSYRRELWIIDIVPRPGSRAGIPARE
ncbi:hypothetical protein GCM10009777_11350 [Microbacterium pumilum]|uniref:EamA domain-containing protein n=2 Tax=Microbacterium pumilum TaxID=344165 RepID=A0ABN2S3K5_9MICO